MTLEIFFSNALGGTVVGGDFYVGATNVTIVRTAGGKFDLTGYDATTYNRGWITITYV